MRPAWHRISSKVGHGRRVIEAINIFRHPQIHSRLRPDSHRLDRASLLPPDGKNFAFVPWRRDGRVPVQVMPSPFGVLRVKTPTAFPKSLGHLPEDICVKLTVAASAVANIQSRGVCTFCGGRGIGTVFLWLCDVNANAYKKVEEDAARNRTSQSRGHVG